MSSKYKNMRVGTTEESYTNIGTYSKENNDIRLRKVPTTLNTFVNVMIDDEFSENHFMNSIFRGTEYKPNIDSEGNLHLSAKYDSLSDVSTLSFAEDYNIAYSYGRRYSHNPYIIEMDLDYLNFVSPEKPYEKSKVGKESFRYKEEDGEIRLSIPQELVIPKGKYNIHHAIPSVSFSNLKDVLNLISSAHKYMDEENIADNMVFSELDGRSSLADAKDIIKPLDKFFGNIDGYKITDILLTLDSYDHGLPVVSPKMTKEIEEKFLSVEELPDGGYYYTLSDEVVDFINNKILKQQYIDAGYSENWIKNATEEEKEVAKYCIGI